MRAQSYQVNGIVLNVWEAGPPEGETIIFLHGFPEAGFAWEAQMAHFAAAGYRVLAPDQRGYNQSSKPNSVRAYHINNLVQDIVALIAAAGAQPVYLVGHDWGGGVAWHLAMQHPQLLRKLIILNMPHPQVMRQTLKHNGKQRLKSSYAGFFQVPLLPEWAASAFDFRLVERSLVRSSLPNTFSCQHIARYKDAWRQHGALTGMINWYRAYRFAGEKPVRVTVPTLVVWGCKDAFLLSEMAAQSVGWCDQGKLVLLPDATHWLHHEFPALVAAHIQDFIAARSFFVLPFDDL